MKTDGYYKVPHTPGLWKHATKPVQFTLVVNDFRVKYVGKENSEHLISSFKEAGYEISIDWGGKLYCRIKLDWDYKNGNLTISISDYVIKLLKRVKRYKPKKQMNTPYKPPPKTYGKESQNQPKKITLA